MMSKPLERVIVFVNKYCLDNWKQWKEDDYHISQFQMQCIQTICPYNTDTLNGYAPRYSDIQQWIDAIRSGELIMRARMRELNYASMYQNALATLSELTAKDVLMDSEDDNDRHDMGDTHMQSYICEQDNIEIYSSMASMQIDSDYFII